MNYQEFLKFRTEKTDPNRFMIDLAKTDIYKAFYIDKSMKNVKGHVNGNIHRCHLVEDWLRFWGLSEDYKSQIGVSSGVRNSLSLLAEEFKDKKWIIPKDVYPYYQYMLSKNTVNFNEYETLIKTQNIFNKLPDGDVLLLTYPFKPLSRDIIEHEVNKIQKWLSEDNTRRLIIDAVYLNTEFKKLLKILFDFFNNEQTYLLFSLSKTFLLPEVLGITFIPNKDLYIREKFKNLSVDKLSLNLAYQALNTGYLNELPFLLNKSLKNQHTKIKKLLKIKNIELPDYNGGYLYYIPNIDFYNLMENNIIAIPESVFGGNNKGIIVSILP